MRNGRWLYRLWPDDSCDNTDGAYWTTNISRTGVAFNFIATNCINHVDENIRPVQSSDPVYVDPSATNTDGLGYWGTRGRPYLDSPSAFARVSSDAHVVVAQTSVPSPPSAQSPVEGTQCAALSGTIQWSAVPGAISYHLRLATDPSLESGILLDLDTESPSWAYTGLAVHTSYYWQVVTQWYAGRAPIISTSPIVSPVFDFTTPQSATAPSAPQLVSPADGATGLPTSGTLDWTDVSGAAGYNVTIRCAGGDIVLSTSSPMSQVAYALSAGTYTWVVSAFDICRRTGEASQTRTLTIGSGNTCTTPVALMPPNGATCVPRAGAVTWDAIPGAAGYVIRFDADPQCKTTGKDAHVGSNSYSYSGLPAGTKCYWSVREDCPCAAFTACNSFTTVPDTNQLAKSLLVSPANGSKAVPTAGTLTWQGNSRAVAYVVQLGTACGVGQEQTVASTSLPYAGLQENTTYYWRVSPQDSCGQRARYSNCFDFTTEQSTGIDRLYIGPGLAFPVGDTLVRIPILGENLSPLREFDFELSIDPSVFDYRGWTLTGTRAEGAGTVAVQYDAIHGRLQVQRVVYPPSGDPLPASWTGSAHI